MAGFKTFLSTKLSRHSHDIKSADQDHNDIMNRSTGMSSSSAPKMGLKRNDSTRLIAGFQKVFGYHRRNDSVPPSSVPIVSDLHSRPAPATSTPTPKRLYRFQSPKQNKHATPTPSLPSTVDKKRFNFEANLLPSIVSSSTPPTSPLTPPTSAHSETLTLSNRHVGATSVTQFTKSAKRATRPIVKTQADSSLVTDIDTRAESQHTLRTSPQPVVVDSTHDISNAHTAGLEAAMEGMRAAEKLLNQRHAAMKPQANTSKLVRPLEFTIKKRSPRDGHDIARLPSNLSPLAHRQTYSRTANQAIEALRRRQAIMDLAFHAADGCPTNIHIMDQITAHFHLQARHTDEEMPDVTFKVNGVSVRASQMPRGSVERNWITRYNAVVNNAELVERRLMSSEDHEMIVAQLFPEERGHILKPEHFDIFMAGLGEEGILTKAQAKSIATVAVTPEEFDKGAHYVEAPANKLAHRRNPTQLAIFDIPQQASRDIASFPPRATNTPSQHDLYYYLRILVEAAVYEQKYWKGYFFPNARSKLDSFAQARRITQEGRVLPPTLTPYKRDWTHGEARLLARGQLISALLARYEASSLTDYGIIRAIRATYVGIPAQPSWCADDLESFLYHRITDSGLAVATVPDILALHPENDSAFANCRLGRHVLGGLRERAQLFEMEEAARLKEIGRSYVTFEEARRKGMTRWGRVREAFRKAFGTTREGVVPFDPFAPEHGLGADKG